MFNMFATSVIWHLRHPVNSLIKALGYSMDEEMLVSDIDRDLRNLFSPPRPDNSGSHRLLLKGQRNCLP